MAAEPTTGVRVAHLVFAIVGTVLLAIACMLTFVVGGLSPMMTDSCSPADFGPGGPDNCRNADAVLTVLLLTPIVVFVASVIGTWLPSRKYDGYVPHGWAPFAGGAVLVAAWFVAESLAPGWFF